MTCKYFSFLHGLLNSEICCHMKNFCCLLVNQFQVPAKHFFLKTIYLGVAKGLQFSWKANRKKSHTHRKGSMGQCSVNNYFCEAKPVATALWWEHERAQEQMRIQGQSCIYLHLLQCMQPQPGFLSFPFTNGCWGPASNDSYRMILGFPEQYVYLKEQQELLSSNDNCPSSANTKGLTITGKLMLDQKRKEKYHGFP